jgi:hypothetical protein
MHRATRSTRAVLAASYCVVVATLAAVPLLSAASQPAALRLYVGAHERDGFVDVDRGLSESIRDVQRELRGKKQVRLVQRREDAQLMLTVVRRGAAGSAGAVAMPIGPAAIAVPIDIVSVEALLRVGDHERQFTGTDETYRRCAKRIVEDLLTWVSANRERLPQ